MKQMKVRDLKKLLNIAGYNAKRTNGSHQIWSNGKHSVSVPIARLKPIMVIKIVSECGLQKYMV